MTDVFADCVPPRDVPPEQIAIRKAAIRAAYDYRYTRWPSPQDSWRRASDEDIEHCYRAFLEHGAWTEAVASADAASGFHMIASPSVTEQEKT